MFNKKGLSLAVAAATTGLSLNAMGQVDWSATTPTPVVVASESVAATTSGLGVGPSTSGATVLDLTGDLGVGIAADDQVFLRFDWDGAVFSTNIAAAALTVNTTGADTVSGGLIGESSAVFGVNAGTAGFSQTDSVTLAISDAGLTLSGSAASFTVRVYEDQTNAINETPGTELFSDGVQNAVTLSAALTVNFTSADATAEVETNFLQFLDPTSTTGGTTLTGTLGRFVTGIVTTGTIVDSDLNAITAVTELATLTTSPVSLEGDFSFATGGFFISGTTDGVCTAGGATAVTPDTASFSTFTSTVDVVDSRALCVTVSGTTTNIIPDTMDYTAAGSLTHVETASSPASTAFGADLGEINRNGTTVEVAYLTTFSEYNQRLIMNNRNSVTAEYFITFQTEDGTVATALPAASGTLAPNQNLTLRASDIVSLDGSSRCSATVVIVAPDGTVSVATTQVNLADGSTDTVSYR